MNTESSISTPMEARQKEVDAFYEQGDKRDLELCRGRPLRSGATNPDGTPLSADWKLKQSKLYP